MATTADDLRADIERRRERMTDTVDAIEDRITPSRVVQRRRQAMQDWAHRTRVRVMGGASSSTSGVSDRMAQGAHEAAEWVTDLPDQMGDRMRGAPLVAGGLAFGVGVLLALVLPETETERQVLEPLAPAVDEMAETAKASARDAASATKDAAADAAQHLRDEAKERGKATGDQIADQVSEAMHRDGPGGAA